MSYAGGETNRDNLWIWSDIRYFNLWCAVEGLVSIHPCITLCLTLLY